MAKIEIKEKAKFVDKLMELYLQDGFGTMNKTELEELFYYLLTKYSDICDSKKKYTDFDRAIMLHIPVSRVQTLAYKSELRFDRYDEAQLRTDFFSKLWNGEFDLVDDGKKIRIVIDRKLLNQYVTSKVKTSNGIPDNSFNKDILTLTMPHFASLLSEMFSSAEQDLIMDEVKNMKPGSTDEFKDLFKAHMKEETTIEIVKRIGEAVKGVFSAIKIASLFVHP